MLPDASSTNATCVDATGRSSSRSDATVDPAPSNGWGARGSTDDGSNDAPSPASHAFHRAAFGVERDPRQAHERAPRRARDPLPRDRRAPPPAARAPDGPAPRPRAPPRRAGPTRPHRRVRARRRTPPSRRPPRRSLRARTSRTRASLSRVNVRQGTVTGGAPPALRRASRASRPRARTSPSGSPSAMQESRPCRRVRVGGQAPRRLGADRGVLVAEQPQQAGPAVPVGPDGEGLGERRPREGRRPARALPEEAVAGRPVELDRRGRPTPPDGRRGGGRRGPSRGGRRPTRPVRRPAGGRPRPGPPGRRRPRRRRSATASGVATQPAAEARRSGHAVQPDAGEDRGRTPRRRARRLRARRGAGTGRCASAGRDGKGREAEGSPAAPGAPRRGPPISREPAGRSRWPRGTVGPRLYR